MPQPPHITKLRDADLSSLDEDLQAYFTKCEEKLGLIPNVLKAYALRPEKLRTFAKMYNELMLGESQLTKLEREMVAVTVSAANRCYYCLVAHGQAVRALADDPQLGEMLVMNHRIADLPAHQRAMLDFAWKLTLTPEQIGDSDRAILSEKGLSDEAVFDLCDVIGFFNYTNRVAHGVDMMPNSEYHAMNRQQQTRPN